MGQSLQAQQILAIPFLWYRMQMASSMLPAGTGLAHRHCQLHPPASVLLCKEPARQVAAHNIRGYIILDGTS